MAARRGIGNDERLALDFAHASASRSLSLAPCFLFAINSIALIDTSATGSVTLTDSSASGDAAKENEKMVFKLGPLGASGGTSGIPVTLPKPIYISKSLVCAVTNAEVSVSYLAAS